MVLESERSSRARGVRPISEISGVASNSNAHDMVVPDAAASAAVMRDAIADAGLSAADIGYVNTHGTGTPVGDPVELDAIRRVIGDRIEMQYYRPAVSYVNVSLEAHAREALALLLRRWENPDMPPQEILIPSCYVPGDSVKSLGLC